MIPLALATLERMQHGDAAFARWLRRQGPVSCGKGCSGCCELLALITWPEAAVVGEVLRERGLVAKYLPALRAQAERASFDGLNARTYFEARIPCAFLEPDHLCGIYEARPAPCRYHVAFSPPVLCADRNPSKILTSDEGAIIGEVIVPICEDCAKDQGNAAYEFAPIPVMVLAALEQLGEEVGSIMTPRAWLDRHREEAWAHHQNEKRQAAGARHG